MTVELLSMVAGALLSLLFSYVPGLEKWYGELDGLYKRLVMLAALVVVAVGIFGIVCLGWPVSGIPETVTCDVPGAVGMVEILILAAMANQMTHRLTPKTKVCC